MSHKAIKAAKVAIAIVNLGPTVSKKLAGQVLSDRWAMVAYILCTILDWCIPCIPVGSVLGIVGFGSVVLVKKYSLHLVIAKFVVVRSTQAHRIGVGTLTRGLELSNTLIVQVQLVAHNGIELVHSLPIIQRIFS